MSEQFLYKPFSEININDEFFDSLKSDYTEFADWFNRKSSANENAFIQLVDNSLEGFLYLKEEDGPVTDVTPNINCEKAIKIGTLKINPHGTRLGERFIKKSLDFAMDKNITMLYVTIFSHHENLLNMFLKFGFVVHGSKETPNGIENVLVKDLSSVRNDLLLDYPLVHSNTNSFLLAIRPEFHTRLFPDSKLYNETFDVIRDVSHTNSISKIYIAKMNEMSAIKPNDNLLIYRTTDIPGKAFFRAVATTICVVEDIKSLQSFNNFNDLKDYCKNYSIFTDHELRNYLRSNDSYYAIKMTYNISLNKRLTRGELINNVGISKNQYWGLIQLTNDEFDSILHLGQVNYNYIID